MIHRHKRKSGIDPRIHDLDIEIVSGVDRLPIVNGRAPERVDAEFESCGVNRLHVYHVFQVIDVRRNEVMLIRCRGADRRDEWDALYVRVTQSQQRVCAFLNPIRHFAIGRSAVGWVVLEPAVLGRVMRRGDDDTVSQAVGATAVMRQDNPRNRRSWRYAVAALNNRLDAVRCEDLERSALGWAGNRMRIAAHVERPADAVSAPVVANRLRKRQDVRFVERPRERRAPVSARTEADLLRGLSWVRLADVIFPYELLRIDQYLFRCRLAGERGKCHGNALLGDG